LIPPLAAQLAMALDFDTSSVLEWSHPQWPFEDSAKALGGSSRGYVATLFGHRSASVLPAGLAAWAIAANEKTVENISVDTSVRVILMAFVP
jgi:hypothetical protein